MPWLPWACASCLAALHVQHSQAAPCLHTQPVRPVLPYCPQSHISPYCLHSVNTHCPHWLRLATPHTGRTACNRRDAHAAHGPHCTHGPHSPTCPYCARSPPNSPLRLAKETEGQCWAAGLNGRRATGRGMRPSSHLTAPPARQRRWRASAERRASVGASHWARCQTPPRPTATPCPSPGPWWRSGTCREVQEENGQWLVPLT